MLIKDLKPISEKLYKAALAQAAENPYLSAIIHNDHLLTESIPWGIGPYASIDFWYAVAEGDLDTARQIDKEQGWGLFDPVGDGVADDTEAVKEMREFQPGDRVVAICDAPLASIYRKGDYFTVKYYDSELPSFKTEYGGIFTVKNFKLVEEPEILPGTKAALEDLSIIRDGLPSDYVPPQAPRKAISFLYNDKQREEAQDYWDRIHRVRHK